MEYLGSTKFDLVELATWKARPIAANTISELVADIVEYGRKYYLCPEFQSRCRSLTKTMAVEFVHKTSVGESVGLQSMEDISAVINAYTNDHNTVNSGAKLLKEEEGKETINIYRALEYVNKLHKEMKNTGILTVQQICDVHRVLMTGLRNDAGEIRKHDVFTWCKDNEFHFYPEPIVAEQILYACVDHHCIQVSPLAKLSVDELLSPEKVEFIFKRAVRLLFDFVDAHPFADGNGRTCRLLANYAVSMITPFPVTPTCGEDKNMRDDYLKAIIECRDHRDKGPGALASMLIEDAWRGWKRLFQNINQ